MADTPSTVDDWQYVPTASSKDDWQAIPVSTPPGAIERMLTSQPGQPWIQGVAQGVGKGAMSTATGLLDILQKTGAQPVSLTPEERTRLTVPQGPGQGTGKFLEQTGEFALPGGIASKGMEALPFAARLATQSGIGGAVSAAQSGGDPTATIIGAGLGGGGELLGSAARTVQAWRNLPLAATPENFREAFAATPSQLARINDATPTLAKYGIGPEKSVPEMKAAVDNQLAELGKQYAAKEAAGLGDKALPAQDVLDGLDKLRARYTTSSGKVPSASKDIVKTIDEQIADVKGDMDASGNIKFKDLRTLRDAVNRKVNWLNPDGDLYSAAGNVYRGGMDQIEPGMADLNRDYQHLSEVSGIADKNIDWGRGMMPSRFDLGLAKVSRPAVGTMLGSQAGAGAAHLIGLPPAWGATIGGTIGAAAYPKLASAATEALQNAVASGKFAALSGAQKVALQMAVRLNDTTGILKILGMVPQAAVSSEFAQSRRAGP
jgi:hypothetical protein